jgi:predicted metal-dependent HD superfamily phosphohydrolase
MSTLTNFPTDFPEGLLRAARVAHDHPPRAYHHFGHVLALQGHLAQLVADGPGLTHPAEVHLAALFHDAVYVAGRSDNEAKSAELAAEAIATFLPTAAVDPARVRHLIDLTARHGKLDAATLDADARHFVDADMAILGAPSAEFDAYDAAIATEYRDAVPSLIYRFNRRRFLARLLDAERIYLSDYFHARFDAPARANLRRALGS